GDRLTLRATACAVYFRYSFSFSPDRRGPHSFPTRRSSDLGKVSAAAMRSVNPTLRNLMRDGVDPGVISLALGSPALECFPAAERSEEHTSELQSRENLVCRLLLEKKNTATATRPRMRRRHG